MRVEHEQRMMEDARLFAEQDASAQRYAAQMLQVFVSSRGLSESMHDRFQKL